ncbi:hypothetical protein [Kineosporia babensis]|uniref:Uncharacterized protein n=1 Tax=Kineosporia babensis TaxID=499548 RepID=A0A9X1NK34_9ACTN|nr:hypothetical protein [Kineosporia babensis]MCD5315151.1 hypothetical protein [Kineosporia babensis]
MITGWIPLYVRSRGVLLALLAALAVIAGIWLLAAEHGAIDERLAVITTGAAMMLAGPTLGTFDQALESTAAMPWPPRRALHLILFALLIAAVLAGIGYAPGWVVLRNCLGLAGLVGIGAALVGVRYGWVPALLWTAPQALFHSQGGPVPQQVLFWLDQPAASTAAIVTAAVLFGLGVSFYARRGGPPVSAAESALPS